MPVRLLSVGAAHFHGWPGSQACRDLLKSRRLLARDEAVAFEPYLAGRPAKGFSRQIFERRLHALPAVQGGLTDDVRHARSAGARILGRLARIAITDLDALGRH